MENFYYTSYIFLYESTYRNYYWSNHSIFNHSLFFTDKCNNNYIRDKTLQERLKRVKEECY